MRYFLFILFAFTSTVNAAYQEMIFEGVKQADGVWTAAGVMDSMGFVRTTGAVAVAGSTASTSVALAADKAATSFAVRSTARSLGPYAIAAVGAYDLYEWMTSDGGEECPEDHNQLCHPVDPALIDDSYTYGSFWDAYNGSRHGYSSTKIDACKSLAYSYVSPSEVNVTVSGSTCYFSGRMSGSSTLTLITCFCSGGVCPGISNQNSCKLPKNPNDPLAIPYTEEDYRNLEDPNWLQKQDAYSKIPQLKDNGIPISSLDFPPFSEWLSDPYFKDGNWYRDRMDISPAPLPSQPTRVRIDVGPVKLEGQTDPNIKPPESPASGSTAPKEQTKFCDDNPQSIACVELGDLEEENITPDERPFQITPQSPWGAGDASCPAPQTSHLKTGAFVTFSYQPTCDFFSSIRPAVIAVAFLVALYIALGISVGKGD